MIQIIINNLKLIIKINNFLNSINITKHYNVLNKDRYHKH